MTDGNTYAINKYLDEREDYDALQEVTTELEQAEARIEELEGKLASAVDVLLESVEPSEVEEGEAETKKYHDAWLEAEAKIVELETKLSNAVEAIFEAIYLLDPDEEDIAKGTGLYRIVTTFKELKGQDDE